MENIDFHEKLIRANLEPYGVKLEYLELVRKETKLSKNAFSIKLSQAYNNLFDVYQGELVKAQNIMLTDIKEYNFPFFYLNKYPGLINVSMIFGFDLMLSEKLLNELLELITLYNEKRILKSVLKEFRNSKPIKEGQESKESNELKNELESIWVRNPKMSIEAFLQKGFDLGLWDEKHELTAQRKTNNVYGSNKTLLANLYLILKENSIKENIDYKKIGEIFCRFFQLDIKPNVKEPFKIFQTGNKKQIMELKKTFKINS
jgi:hypothetical protein